MLAKKYTFIKNIPILKTIFKKHKHLSIYALANFFLVLCCYDSCFIHDTNGNNVRKTAKIMICKNTPKRNAKQHRKRIRKDCDELGYNFKIN